MNLLKSLPVWNDAWFQGANRRRRYFEGWYFKMVSPGAEHIYAVIPGIAMGADKGDRHAFIQLIDGKTAQTAYFSFPFDAFRFDPRAFRVWIGDNFFSAECIELAIPGQLEGMVRTHRRQTYPFRLLAPGIMNWYRFAPFMECYHGVVSMDHELEGALVVNGETKPLTSGRGYIEKDWGQSFPKAWVWMQGNQFAQAGASIMLSVADIPWIGYNFTGFLGFLLHPEGLFTLGTYTGARIRHFSWTDQTTRIVIENRGCLLEISARRAHAGLLQAPAWGVMDRGIAESVDAAITLSLSRTSGGLIFEGESKPSGLELVGDLDGLRKKIKTLAPT